VRWTQSALNELAEIWLAADVTDRGATTAATDQLDLLPARNPDSVGVSPASNRRIAFAPPPAFMFSVQPEDLVVRVLHVRRYGQ
jgi:hypothetical protein